MSEEAMSTGGGPTENSVDAVAAMKALKETAEVFWHEWSEKHKRANILVAGKTGTGKSTLINAVFRENLAKAGIGRSVTKGVVEVTKEGSPLCILDTEGLELKDYDKIKSKIIDNVRSRRGDDPNTYVHLAWLCVAETGARIESGDIDLARELKALGLTVIVVVTKTTTFKENPFEIEVRREFDALADEIVLTRGLAERQYDDDDNLTGTRPIRGVDELIEHSYRFIPDSQRQSFVNALAIKNRAALDAKRKEANHVVNVAATAAGGIGATPIPFSDAIALVPIQGAMIVKISQVYGIELGRDAAIPIVSSLLGLTGTTLIGRTIIASLLKLVPGVGTVAGGALAGGTAAALTKGLGQLYISTLDALAREGKLDLQAALSAIRGGNSLREGEIISN